LRVADDVTAEISRLAGLTTFALVLITATVMSQG